MIILIRLIRFCDRYCCKCVLDIVFYINLVSFYKGEVIIFFSLLVVSVDIDILFNVNICRMFLG